MAIKLVSVKCPECGATLDIEEGRNQAFCSYCGTKILLQNENEHIYRHVDEAEVKRAETEHEVRVREAEIEKAAWQHEIEMDIKNDDLKKKMIPIWLGASGVLMGLGFLGMAVNMDNMFPLMSLLIGMSIAMCGGLAIFGSDSKKIKRTLNPNEARILETMEDCRNQDYHSVIALFSSAGFTNINLIPLNDLNFLSKGKNGRVQEVTINGDHDFEAGDIFERSATVTIVYHSIKEK